LPWICLWFFFSDPDVDRGLGIVALHALLVLGTVGLVVLPLLATGLRRKRWLLILLLGTVNVYWCLRWIEALAASVPGDSQYATARFEILSLMAVWSLAVLAVYGIADRLLRLYRRR
jgi:hypothetical protein